MQRKGTGRDTLESHKSSEINKTHVTKLKKTHIIGQDANSELRNGDFLDFSEKCVRKSAENECRVKTRECSERSSERHSERSMQSRRRERTSTRLGCLQARSGYVGPAGPQIS